MYKSALEIIKEQLSQEDGAMFHNHSRAPFDSEQPVIAAAKAAMGDKTWSQVPYKPPGIRGTIKVRKVIPQWLYENTTDILQRVINVEAFMHEITWVANDLQVNCDAKLFETIKSDSKMKSLYNFYTSTPESATLQDGDGWLNKKRWMRLSRTLFVVVEE